MEKGPSPVSVVTLFVLQLIVHPVSSVSRVALLCCLSAQRPRALRLHFGEREQSLEVPTLARRALGLCASAHQEFEGVTATAA